MSCGAVAPSIGGPVASRALAELAGPAGRRQHQHSVAYCFRDIADRIFGACRNTFTNSRVSAIRSGLCAPADVVRPHSLIPAEHKVLPQHVEQYKKLIADYYKGIHDSSDFDAKLTGSWEVTVGEVDTFGETHRWR